MLWCKNYCPYFADEGTEAQSVSVAYPGPSDSTGIQIQAAWLWGLYGCCEEGKRDGVMGYESKGQLVTYDHLLGQQTKEKVKLLIQLADSFVEKGHIHATEIRKWVTTVDKHYRDFSLRMGKYRYSLEKALGVNTEVGMGVPRWDIFLSLSLSTAAPHCGRKLGLQRHLPELLTPRALASCGFSPGWAGSCWYFQPPMTGTVYIVKLAGQEWGLWLQNRVFLYVELTVDFED